MSPSLLLKTLGSLFLIASPLHAANDTIRIGEVGSMTGSQATFGMSTHKGAALAVQEINAAGGVHGKKLELISLDNQGKPEEAATAVTRLITQDKVVAIIGEVASSRSLAMAPIAQKNKIPMISPASTSPKVTEVGDYIFRICFIDPFQGSVMAKFAAENLKFKKVAILQDVKNEYSVGLAEFFTKSFESKGGKVIVNQSYSEGDMDFSAQLTAIRTQKPEAIFVPGYYTEVGLIAMQKKRLGIKAPMLGGDGWESPKLTEIGKDAIKGSYFSNHYSAEDKTPTVQEFIQKFKKTYNETPDGMAALGYDAVLILGDAMKRSKKPEPTLIREQLAGTKDFRGVTGKITIDDKRNAVKSAVVLEVAGPNQFAYKTTIDP